MKIKYSNLLLVGLLLPMTMLSAEDVSLTPPDAKPGECYARVISPAKYETIEEQVMVKEATEEITIVPAKYETVEQEVEVIPAIKKLIPVPATYKEVVETVETKPATRTWKTSLTKKALPVSPVILAAIKDKGIDLSTATANTCFKEYYTPETYKVVTEDVMVQNERNETEEVPASFDMQVENIEVTPASKVAVEIPAEFEYAEEEVLVEEEKTVWKKGQNPAQKLSGATGEIMCLVKVPAKYKTIKKLVVKSPARTEVQDAEAQVKTVAVQKVISEPTLKKTLFPAEYISVEKNVLENNASFMWTNADDSVDKPWKATGNQACLVETKPVTKEIVKVVLDMPETVAEELIPATFEVVPVQKLVEEAKEVRIPIEAEYAMINKRKKLADTHVGWKRILCQTNMTKEVIEKIQTALNEKSYNTGKPDGVLGKGTRNALERYQKDNALATGGITYETLGSLNIEL